MKPGFAPIAGVLAASAFLTVMPARAGDDGQASLASGLASTFGLSKQDDPKIDYRERSKLVVPRKRDLPPPGASTAAQDPSWPVDVETAREKKLKKMEDAGPSAKDVAQRDYRLIKPGDDVKVTTSGFHDSGAPACRVPDPKTGECPAPPHASINWNPLTWVGIQKKPMTVLGPEPERENLVDPPKGYRAPAEGVGVKVEN